MLGRNKPSRITRRKDCANPRLERRKAEYVVQSICKILASPDTPQVIRDELGNQALWNALKLFSDALEDRLGSRGTKWSPALVELFINKPDQCNQWLELMAEPEFSAGDYWKQDDEGV